MRAGTFQPLQRDFCSPFQIFNPEDCRAEIPQSNPLSIYNWNDLLKLISNTIPDEMAAAAARGASASDAAEAAEVSKVFAQQRQRERLHKCAGRERAIVNCRARKTWY